MLFTSSIPQVKAFQTKANQVSQTECIIPEIWQSISFIVSAVMSGDVISNHSDVRLFMPNVVV